MVETQANTWKYWTGLDFDKWLEWKRFSWLSWDGWILHAYMDQIDFNGIVDANPHLQGQFQHKPLTREEKAQLLNMIKGQDDLGQDETFGQAALKAIRADKDKKQPQNHKRKTFIHYLGWAFVILVSIASAFSVAPFVAGLIQGAFGGPSRYIYAIVCICTTWANIAVFRKNTTDVMKRLFGFGWPGAGLFVKEDKKIRVGDNHNLALQYKDGKAQEMKIEGWSRGLMFFGFICALAMAATTASLNLLATPDTLGELEIMSMLGAKPAFSVTAWALASATFFCVLSALSFAFIKWASTDNKAANLKSFCRNLFGAKEKNGEWHYPLVRTVLTGTLILFCALGLFGTAFVQSTKFYDLAGGPLALSLFIGVGLAFIGKLPFVINNVTNVINLIMNGGKVSENSRDTIGKGTKAALGFNGIFNGILSIFGAQGFVEMVEDGSDDTDNDCDVDDPDCDDDGGDYDLATSAPMLTAGIVGGVGGTLTSWGAATGEFKAETKEEREKKQILGARQA